MRALLLLILIAVSAGAAAATTRHVPADYPTIAAAFAAVLNGDTVIVQPGVYAEALVAPNRSFTLMGSARIDSSTTEFSVIDPTEIAGSDTLRCLKVNAALIRVHDMVFRNRWQMTVDRPASLAGGIQADTLNSVLEFHRCIFDSLFGAIYDGRRVVIDNCRFIGTSWLCVRTPRGGRVYADSTLFDGMRQLVSIRQGGYFGDSRFVCHGDSRLLNALGDSLIFERCTFTATDSLASSALSIRPRCGSAIRDCRFIGILSGGAILEIIDSCFAQPKGWECAIELQRNSFSNCGSGGGASPVIGGEMIHVTCNDVTIRGYLALMDSTAVDSTHVILGESVGFRLEAGVELTSSTFGETFANNLPQVYVNCPFAQDSVWLRNNDFNQDLHGVARNPFDEVSFIDARENWWGDASGPHHAVLNPGGQGAEVSDDILFTPWLTVPPDSSDTTSAVGAIPELMPQEYSISAYPNPFNAQTTITLNVSRPGAYELRLFDITGREAARLFSGMITATQAVRVNGSDVSSGVYFAQLRDARHAVAAAKLLLLK